VGIGRVLDADQPVALGAAVAHLGSGSRAVGQQPLAVARVDPRSRHHPRASPRPDLVLELLDDGVHRVGRDQPALDQQRLKRHGAQLRR